MLTDGADQADCGMFAKPVAGSTGKTHVALLEQPAKLYGSPWVMVPAGSPIAYLKHLRPVSTVNRAGQGSWGQSSLDAGQRSEQ